jgi:hypothetical protein
VVVAAAAVDAVRHEGAPAQQPAATGIADRDEVAAALAALGARGELVLHDGVCGEATLALPGLERRESTMGCAPLGVRSPDGTLVARCVDGRRIEVSSVATGELEWFDRGCLPAWRPDGALTAVYGGQIVRLRPCASFPCIAIAPPELERAARRHPTSPALAPLRVLVDGVAWLSNRRAAVLMSIRLVGGHAGMGPMAGVAFFDDGRLVDAQPFFRVTAGRLDVSPGGGYVTLTPDVVLRADGTQVNLPQHLRDVRDFAWSPDESFLALATPHAVVVLGVGSLEGYDATGGGLRSVTIPQPAARLDWR